MTADEMEVENLEAMEDSGSTSSEDDGSSGGDAHSSGEGHEDMEGSDEEREEKASNPAFSKFMQGFWDLASVDVPVRVGAAAMIVRHVSAPDGGDAEYAVKRLVRGMCSSRECARQGFASCLAQVLTVLPKDEPTTPAVLEQILKATQTTVAMKGADERELALGRLLGVSALAMSGRLGSAPESAEVALKAVAELYTRRKWIGQAAGEAALLVTSKAFEGEGEFLGMALPLLAPLLKGKDGSTLQIVDLSPDQLLLCLGLRSIMRQRGLDPQEDDSLKQALPPFLRHASVVRAGKIQDLIAPLKQSASAFPKVHSVWSRLWDDLGLSPAREQTRASLSAKRLKKLGEVWSAVVDGALTSTSLNNKGTAVLVLKQVLQRVPAAGVWHVLSPGIVRLMLNHTKGEENYLYSLVCMTLKQLPKIVKDDQEVQAQVAACLLRRGTIRFDSRVGINVIASLVRGMGQEALDAHVEFLKGVVQGKSGWTDAEGSMSNGAAATSGGDGQTPASNEHETTDGSGLAERLQAVEALCSLARSFGGGGGGGGRKGDARTAAISTAMGGGPEAQGKRMTKTAKFLLEAGFFTPEEGATALPPKLQELCRSKFFSLIADIANKPLFWGTSSSTANTTSDKKKSPSKKTKTPPPSSDGAEATWGALEALWSLHETWQALEAGGSGSAGRKLVKGVSVGPDEREACALAVAVVGRIRAANGERADKLGSAFAGILLMVSLHLLEGSEEDGRGEERCEHITDLVETYGRMSGNGKGSGEDDEDDEDDDEEDRNDPDPLSMLADVLVAVVAEPSAHSVRGLRDTARRVWGMVCGVCPLTKSALDTLLAAVCGEDDGGSSDSDGEQSENEDEDEVSQHHAQTARRSAAASDDRFPEKMFLALKETRRFGVEGRGDSVMVDPSDLQALLTGNDNSSDDDEDGGEGLQHHAGADKALGALLGLKKSGRKKGALEAQRQGFQIRLRALDLLEVVCSRRPDSQYLLAALLAVLKAIKKLESSGVGNRAGGEASALSIRLQTLYKNRLCKCKPRVIAEEEDQTSQAGTAAGKDDEEAEEFSAGFSARTAEDFSELIGLCRAWEKDARLASLALEGALSCLRSLKGRRRSLDQVNGVGKKGKAKAAGGKDSKGAQEALERAFEALAASVDLFFAKRRGGGFTPVQAIQVEEVVKRFPEVLAPVLVKAAQKTAASDFLRTEAFRLLGGVLQRRSTMDPTSRDAVLAQCPAIFKALADAFCTTATEAASANAATATSADGNDSQSATATEDKKKTPSPKANPASSTMLKAKRLKPLLACLSTTLSSVAAAAADDDDESGVGGNTVGSLSGLGSEAKKLKAALEAVGEASASLAMQLQCGQVAQELDEAFAGMGGADDAMDADGDDVGEQQSSKKKKKKRKVEEEVTPSESSLASPKRTKAAKSDSPATTPTSGKADAGTSKAKGSSSSKKKKKKERKEE
ncbi:unnamed protein product [Scytosiphon promiscuus]